MPQKARPGEPTLLELVSGGKLRTSEDIPELSESEIFSEWVLPAVTGASAETDEYQPGALDLAFTVPVVGGSIKTGFKLAKEAAKKIGSAYRRSVRPRAFPQKDELLRESAESIEPLSLEDIFVTGENMGDAIRRMNEFGGYDVVQQRLSRARGGPLTGLSSEEIAQNTRSQLSELTQRLDEIQTQRPATQSTRGVTEAAEEFFREHPNLRLDPSELAEATPARRVPGSPGSYQRGDYARQAATPIRTADESIAHIIRETQGAIRGGVGGGNLTYSQARSIYDDIGLEGFNEFKDEIASMTQDARELAVDNFMAKYKLSAGTLSGQEAAVVYKRTRFTSDMPDQVITTSKAVSYTHLTLPTNRQV